MTNKEFFKEDILEIACSGSRVAVINNKPTCCIRVKECRECMFYNSESCGKQFVIWCNSEYQEPDWSKVAVDTKILVKGSPESCWYKRHFAKCEDGKIYAYANGNTSWTARSTDKLRQWVYAKLVMESNKK